MSSISEIALEPANRTRGSFSLFRRMKVELFCARIFDMILTRIWHADRFDLLFLKLLLLKSSQAEENVLEQSSENPLTAQTENLIGAFEAAKDHGEEVLSEERTKVVKEHKFWTKVNKLSRRILDKKRMPPVVNLLYCFVSHSFFQNTFLPLCLRFRTFFRGTLNLQNVSELFLLVERYLQTRERTRMARKSGEGS